MLFDFITNETHNTHIAILVDCAEMDKYNDGKI